MLLRTRLGPARAAVTTTFFTTGFVLGTWLVNIPAAQARTGSSAATLGTVLLVLGAGAFLAMQTSGRLCSRYGSRRIAAVGAVWLAAALNLPGLSQHPLTLALGLFALGLGNGLVNVAMNAQAAELEQRYRRPIMSGFHAFFSIGGAAAAALTAAATALGATLPLTLGTASLLALALTALTIGRLLPARPPGASASTPRAGDALPGAPSPAGSVALLAAIAAMMMLAEGAAGDWSSLHAVQLLDASPSTAALTYGAFALAMTTGRLTADRVVARTGPIALVRGGALLAGAGFVLVVLSPHLALTIAGWALAGLGLAGIVPQLITAAGRLPGPHPERRLATVVSTGYLGLLSGPAVIGFLAEASDLRLALLLTPVLCLVAVLAAPWAIGAVPRRPVPAADRPTERTDSR